MDVIEVRPGVTIAYEDQWFGPPWQDKETVLMIHGIAESSKSWTCWVPPLSGRFRVLRLDLPGFGGSTAPRDYGWRPATLAADVAGFLDGLGLARVHVVAAKYGGTVAMRFAIDFADRLLSLSIFGSPVKVPGGHFENGTSTPEALRTGRRAWVERTMRRRLGSAVSEAQIAWWVKLMVGADLDAFIGATTAIEDPALETELRRITVPCLIVTTAESGLQSVAATREYQEKIPDSRLVVLPGDGYHIAAAEPEVCAGHFLSFVQGIRHKTG